MASSKSCQYCKKSLSRDEIGLSRKLFEPESRCGKFSCLSCMAEMLEIPVEDLLEKIEAFKAQGCKLFS